MEITASPCYTTNTNKHDCTTRRAGEDREREEIEREEHADYTMTTHCIVSGSTWPTPAEEEKDKGKYCSEYRLKIKRRRTRGAGGGDAKYFNTQG